MTIDKRKHARIKPDDLSAVITISPPAPDNQITLKGLVLDMSASGIKIKLFSAMPANIPKSKIKIDMVMPKSGLPITIKGIIKRLDNQSECGIKYHQEHPDKTLDNLMFECIKRPY
jgi:hypothetical protein